MVHFIQEKFSYELASPIYMVNIFPNLFKKQKINFKYNLKAAALLKISRLNSWINKPYCKDTIRDGLRSISCVYFSFFPTEPDESTNTDHLPPTTPMTGNSVNSEHFFGRFFDESGVDNHESSSESCRRFILEKELDKEILKYTDMISKPELIKAYKSSNLFWQKYSMVLPMLRTCIYC